MAPRPSRALRLRSNPFQWSMTWLPGKSRSEVPGYGAAAAAAPYTGTSERLFPGSHVIDHWNGFDLSLNARLGRGAILQGGVGTGRQIYDNCDIADPAKATQWNGHSIVGSMANIAGLAPAGGAVQSISNCH